MDKPTLDALRELNGEGTQTDVDIDTVTVDGQTGTALDGLGAKRHFVMTNVTQIRIDAADTGAVAIGYTNPTLSGIE